MDSKDQIKKKDEPNHTRNFVICFLSLPLVGFLIAEYLKSINTKYGWIVLVLVTVMPLYVYTFNYYFPVGKKDDEK